MHVPLYPGRGSWPDWNNPDVLQRDRLPARAAFVPYPDQNSCRHAVENHRRYLSPTVLSLKGSWDFRYYPSILQLPENILSFRSGFTSCAVPAGRPVLPVGSGQTGLPFPLDAPHVIAEQPVMVYRRTCKLPLTWSSLRKRLVLQGIRAAGHVFVNSKCAGYTQGSGLMAEFDITGLLHDGENEIFIIVYPYSCGSYLEAQPERPWFGLIREVTLEAVPSLTIHDVKVQTAWLPDEEAWRLDLAVQLVSCRIAVEQPVVHASLRFQDESCYEASWTVFMKPADDKHFAPPVQTSGKLHASLLVRDVLPWCDEKPVLYDLYVSLEDRRGHDLVCVHQAVGFCALQQAQGQLLLNGRPLRLRGVRWSGLDEADPTENIPALITALKRYKRHQVNTIWFKDVPPDPIVLDLCDVYGFYVIEDAPLSLQDPGWIRAMRQLGADWPRRWAEDRLSRLVERDKNHPCLVAWSCDLFLADPAGLDHSELVGQLQGLVRSLDPGRFLHGMDLPDLGRHLDAWMGQDTVRPASLDWLRLPGAAEAGWCLLDHDSPPEFLTALGQLLQPLHISAVNPVAGTFQIVNRLTWNDAGLYSIAWDLLRQGRPVLSGELDNVRVLPGEAHPVAIWYGDQDFQDDAEYLIRFILRQTEATLWTPKGAEIGTQLFQLQKGLDSSTAAAGHGGRLRLESERHHLIVSGSRFWLVFNRIHASLESWRTGDRELLAARSSQTARSGFLQLPGLAGTRCRLMRQPEPFDGPDWSRWLAAGYDRLQLQVRSVEDGCDGRTAAIDMVAHLGVAGKKPLFHLALRYEVLSQGALRLFASLTPLMPDLLPPPCFSICFNPARSCQTVAWLGSGPERQPARIALSGQVAHHERDLAGLAQARRGPGVFRDARRLVVRDDSGFGLAITSDHLFAFDVYLADETDDAGLTAGRVAVQLIHQASLACRPLAEPLKIMFAFNPVV